MNQKITIAIGADHAGFNYKETIKKHLLDNNFEVVDFGAFSENSVDYPDFAHPVAKSVESGESELGVLVCGSANGVAITANKHQNIRAAIAWQTELASLAKQHNNANVVCIPARFIDEKLALDIVDTFLKTEFEGGRHERRVSKMTC